MFRLKTVLDFDMINLDRLVMQSAACVLVVCKERVPEGAHAEPNPTDRIGTQLNEFLALEPSEYTNALQAQVELIYDFVHMMVRERDVRFTIDMNEARLLVAALSAYQDWKTKMIVARQLEMGPNWGTETGFHKADWTNLNDQLMELLQQPS